MPGAKKRLQGGRRRAFFLCGLIGSALAVLLSPLTARADRRAYGETYEAVTAPQGELDVEVWNTYAEDGELNNGPVGKGYRGMLELEYGITSRWDVALYNFLDILQDPSETRYSGFKIETRFRLVPAGEWFVDPILYLEYMRLFQVDTQHKWEVKLILGKDIGPWNVSTNLAFELERKIGAKYIPELEYNLGISREVFGPAFKIGAEIFGRTEKPPDEEEWEVFAWAGPAISWATSVRGVMRGFWITVAGGKGLTNQSKAYYGRAIIGLQF